jgi:hypothetical protein
VKEAKEMVEESDIKYDEVARKLAMVSSHFLFLNCLAFLNKHNEIRKYFQSCDTYSYFQVEGDLQRAEEKAESGSFDFFFK